MARSMKNCEVKLLTTNKQQFGKETKSIVGSGQDVLPEKRWVGCIPLGVRKVCAGIAFATMLFTSPVVVHAQDAPQVQMKINETKTYEVSPSDELKKLYARFKQGEISEDKINAKITVEAVQFLRNNNLKEEELADVFNAFKNALEERYNKSNECKKFKNIGAKKGKKPASAEEEKEAAPPADASAEEEKEAAPPADASAEEEKKPASASAEEKKEAAPPAEASAEEEKKPIEEENKELPKFRLSVLGNGVESPNKLYGSMFSLLTYFQEEDTHIGLSVMSGYNGERHELLDEVIYSRHASLFGIGPTLRFAKKLTATMLLKLDGYNVGLLAYINSPEIDALLTTQLSGGKPTRLSLTYWNTESKYPIIISAKGDLGSVQGVPNNSKYEMQYGLVIAQFPLWYDFSNYLNIVVGGLASNINAGPTDYYRRYGLIFGSSLTSSQVNVGVGCVVGHTESRKFNPNTGYLTSINGNIYDGSISGYKNDINGLAIFANTKLLNLDDIADISANIEYLNIDGDQIFSGSLKINIQW